MVSEGGSDFLVKQPAPPPLVIPEMIITNETDSFSQNDSNVMFGSGVVGYYQMMDGEKNRPYGAIVYLIGTVAVDYDGMRIPVTIFYDSEGYFLSLDKYDISGVRHTMVDSSVQTSIQLNSLTNEFWRATIVSRAGWRNWLHLFKSLANTEMHLNFWGKDNPTATSQPDISIGGPWNIRAARLIYSAGATNLMLKVRYSALRNDWSDRNSIKSITDLASATLRISSGMSAVFGAPNKNLLRQIDLQFGASAITLTNLYPIQDRGTNWVETQLPANSELLGSGEIK